MRLRLSSILMILMFVSFLVFVYLQMEKNRQQGQQFNMQLSDLDMRVKQLDSKLNRAQERIRELEKTSLKGVVNDANDAIVQGFGAMIGVMETELKKARERLGETSAKSPEAPEEAPSGESAPGAEGQ